MVIQKGVLKPGMFLIMGETYTKVKEMKDDSGNTLCVGIPGDAVEIIGLSAVPKAG
jgi:translation initiation factor IF-2